MAKRRLGLIALLFCLCLCLMPCDAHAASYADAKELIDPAKDCRLSLIYSHESKAFKDLAIKLYKVASISADFEYSLTAPFQASGLELNGVQTQTEWKTITSTLEAHILANKLEASYRGTTDAAGALSFTGLKPGLYLVSAVEVAEDDYSYIFDTTLIALPGLGDDGLWKYEPDPVKPKPGVLPPIGGDSKTEYSVLKLWKGDRYHSRPKSVGIEIYKDGEIYKSVTLSAENDWSYTWDTDDSRADWMVVERDIPVGYTVTVDERETTFVVTNSRIPDPYKPPHAPPKTGDSSNILLYLGLMYASGAALILLGIFAKRKRV